MCGFGVHGCAAKVPLDQQRAICQTQGRRRDRNNPRKQGPRDKGNDDAGKDQEQAQRAPGFGIVGVGSSAGGLDALQALLGALPADTGLSFVLVPHLDPSHTSLMSQLLAAHAKMPVQELRRDQPAAPDHIFVIPPGHLLTIEHGVLRLARVPAEGGSALRREAAIETFLRSLAVDQQQRAIGIVLSGTGSQGTLGLRHVKDEGGMTLVQDPATAQFDAMPRSAIAAGVADHVLSPPAIAAELTRYARHAAGQGLWRPHPDDGSDPEQLTACLLYTSDAADDLQPV